MNKSGQRRTHGKPGKWWKVSCALLPAAFACETSEAQSSVTLYGIADTSVRYLSKADTAGNGRFLMGPGGLSESRWGIKGVEDLGGGWSTTFKLENRFLLNNGQSDPSMPFFNEAQIGLQSSTYGHLVLGRQYNVMIEGVVMGGYSSNPWIPSDFNFQPEVTMTGGIWSSNQVQYHGRYKDFRVSTAYSFSGNAGRMAYGSQYGVAAAYAPANGPFTLGGAYKETKDSINGSNGKAWTFGGSYTWDKTRFALGYLVNQNDKGYSTFANGPFTAQGLAALKYSDFKRRTMILGDVTQQVGFWHLAGNVWRTLQAGKTQPQDGAAWQFQLVADYDLSKRTDVYLETDYSLYRAGLIGSQLQGVNAVSLAQKSTQLGVMAGIRHKF
ncbi:outer membrane protein (porin) [Caballeronia udeis]|uniref:Outer membrane protein (Porin) n=1 Tax=Caballeronia udeis TaxID=1232866 RepID=A0A158I483_9BURK|nr:porin [Caballeronia udeis]SAL51163.1 outer membrane protein (porin) [Caballeronia udeis]